MSQAKVQGKIDRLVERRRRAWRDGKPTAEMNARLDELYGELRLARARSSHGAPDVIARRARVDRELEKLYTA